MTILPELRRGSVALVMLSIVLLGACSGGDGGAEDAVAGQAGQDTEEEGEATEGESAAAAPTDGPRVEAFDPSDSIVEQTVSLQENPDDKVTLAIQSLRVEGKAMRLRLIVTPHFTSVGASDTLSLYEVWETRRFSPLLVDLENLKEYSVISNGDLLWTSDPGDTWAVNGEPMLAWAVFPAAEDDIDTVEVRVTEWWPPFVDVPIER